jgi:hypothetical protein
MRQPKDHISTAAVYSEVSRFPSGSNISGAVYLVVPTVEIGTETDWLILFEKPKSPILTCQCGAALATKTFYSHHK